MSITRPHESPALEKTYAFLSASELASRSSHGERPDPDVDLLVSDLVDGRDPKAFPAFCGNPFRTDASPIEQIFTPSRGGAAVTLEELSTQQARQLAPLLTNAKGLPWTIIMLIDATLQTRSGLQTENVQRFNHGYGYVIGHQWTNIVLVLNEVLIPLPPIPFYSKHYCRKLQIAYHTEHDRLVEYLTAFDLERYLGPYRPDKVVVLMDSGYDVKKVLSTIRGTHWHFLCARNVTEV